MDAICPISGESVQEERINYLTHLAGFILSLFAVPFLVWVSTTADFWMQIAIGIYSCTLICLYAASTFYHRTTCIKKKSLLKFFDHACIYLFIAGSYTPFTLGPLRELGGITLFSVVWGIALVGILFKVLALDKFKWISLFSYLIMGWLVIFNLPSLIEILPMHDLLLTFGGGLCYTCGTLFYATKWIPFGHGVWHLFVLGGSICHYCCILHFF